MKQKKSSINESNEPPNSNGLLQKEILNLSEESTMTA